MCFQAKSLSICAIRGNDGCAIACKARDTPPGTMRLSRTRRTGFLRHPTYAPHRPACATLPLGSVGYENKTNERRAPDLAGEGLGQQAKQIQRGNVTGSKNGGSASAGAALRFILATARPRQRASSAACNLTTQPAPSSLHRPSLRRPWSEQRLKQVWRRRLPVVPWPRIAPLHHSALALVLPFYDDGLRLRRRTLF